MIAVFDIGGLYHIGRQAKDPISLALLGGQEVPAPSTQALNPKTS